MKYRPFGRTGWQVSEISFGAWAIGGSWGKQDDDDSVRALHRAIRKVLRRGSGNTEKPII